MYSKAIRELAKKLSLEGKSYSEISLILKIPRSSIQKIIKSTYVPNGKLNGRPKLIEKKEEKVIKNAVRVIKKVEEKVTSTKILQRTKLSCSQSTVQRTLRRLNLKYRKQPEIIQLTTDQKEKRMKCIECWFSKNIDFQKVIFSDEKRFKLDGPDNFKTWCNADDKNPRRLRQNGGGGVTVHGALGYDGFLRLIRLDGNLNGDRYLVILENLTAEIKLRYNDFYFMHDGAPPHRCLKVKSWLDENCINTLNWPSYSPDMNVIEHVWHLISEIVYDGPQFKKNDDLWEAILKSAERIKTEKLMILNNFFNNYSNRLCSILKNNGDTYK